MNLEHEVKPFSLNKSRIKNVMNFNFVNFTKPNYTEKKNKNDKDMEFLHNRQN